MNTKKPFLEIGKVVTTHGILGEIRLYPWCDDPGEITHLPVLYRKNGQEAITVERARVHKNIVILKLAGVDSVEEGRKLRDEILFAARDDMHLAEGEYFVQDLIGLLVVDADTGEEYGVLTDVSKTGANDVYHIGPAGKEQKLVPAIKDVVIETDIENKIMKIRPLKGLFDDAD